jgi:hypothetical protein
MLVLVVDGMDQLMAEVHGAADRTGNDTSERDISCTLPPPPTDGFSERKSPKKAAKNRQL